MRRWVKVHVLPRVVSFATAVLTFSFIGFGLTGCSQSDIQNFSNQLTEAISPTSSSSPAPNGPQGVDAVGLGNILPPFDPSKPISQQYPHIAISVLSSPPGWANGYLSGNTSNSGLNPGCFELQAIVWSDSQTSKTTAPFSWCIPADADMELGPSYVSSLDQSADVNADNSIAGGSEPEGPRPPDTFFPTDNQTADLYMQNNSQHFGTDLNADETSTMALMFANVRHQLGVNVSGPPDHRVWISSISDTIK